MTIDSCMTCGHHRRVWMDERERHDHRCFRPMTYRGHSKPYVPDDGVSCPFERDRFPESMRVDGDKCGPDGKHWTARNIT